MKTKIILICSLVLMICSTSCVTTQKFVVYGEPGTEISRGPGLQPLGVIDDKGSVKIKVQTTKDIYYPYLLAHTPGTNEYIPFALDYTNVSMIQKGWLYASLVGVGVAGAGIAMGIEGTAGLITTIAGGVTTEISLMVFALTQSGNTPLEHMRYLKQQYTIQNLPLTKPVFDSQPRPIAGLTSSKPAAKENSTTDNSGGKKIIGDKSKKILKDDAKNSEGRYIVSGSLTDRAGNVVERYASAVIIIERIDKKTLNVNVEDDDGQLFFDTPNKYTVTKDKNGSYQLKHGKISNAILTIDGDEVQYSHPRVVIDGETYVLKLTGSKEN